jgi:hypothetical protein
MADSEVTNGELARLIQSQGGTLKEIRDDVRAQNGSIAKHETRISVLEERIGNLKEKDPAARYGALGAILAAAGGIAWHWIKG